MYVAVVNWIGNCKVATTVLYAMIKVRSIKCKKIVKYMLGTKSENGQ